jgi:hypothetical protein
MTPKEKAKYLFDYYFPLCGHIDPWGKSKQCAIICVEEILNANPIVPLEYMLESEALDKAREYWQSVKTEIEKL